MSHFRAGPAPLAQIVSGNPALKKGTDGDSVRWHSPASKIYFDASLDNAGKHAREAVQLGFGTWIGSGAKLPSLNFDSTTGAKFGQLPNGKSEVMYGPITLAGHENDLALTVTFSDPKTGEVVESDMIFNSKHPYGVLPYSPMSIAQSASIGNSSGCDQKYDLQSVATHEAGHFFGLGEDLVEHQATMFQSIAHCETHKRVLALTDVSAVTTLYAKSADPEEAKAGARACSFGRAPASEGALAVSAGILALSLLRRRRAR